MGTVGRRNGGLEIRHILNVDGRFTSIDSWTKRGIGALCGVSWSTPKSCREIGYYRHVKVEEWRGAIHKMNKERATGFRRNPDEILGERGKGKLGVVGVLGCSMSFLGQQRCTKNVGGVR